MKAYYPSGKIIEIPPEYRFVITSIPTCGINPIVDDGREAVVLDPRCLLVDDSCEVALQPKRC